MDYLGNIFHTILLATGGGLLSAIVGNASFSALNDSFHARQLYLKLHTPSPPSDSIRTHADDAASRRQICVDIMSSKFFEWFPLRGNTMIDPYSERYLNVDTNIAHQIDNHPRLQEYFEEASLEYKQRKINLNNYLHYLEEYVFICPLLNSISSRIYTVEISKEYNVGPTAELYKPGRFVFGSLMLTFTQVHNILILAEEPASTYTEFGGFNVELYYLRLRKHVEPARSANLDPVCNLLISGEANELMSNQYYRLCVAVSRSADFADKIRYPRQSDSVPPLCQRKEVSFKTPEAIKEAAGRKYYERIVICESIHVDPRKRESHLYVSRAYSSNEVFVYLLDPTVEKMYLENLSTNMSFSDELNSFNFTEY